jgi:plastocyanin
MKHFSRRRRVAALVATTLAIASTAAVVHTGQAASASVAPGMKPAVTISNYSFHPATLTVNKGSTVIWVNKDGDVHTIKSTGGPETFNSPALDSGNQFGFTFHRAGTYHYTCSVHPYMHGVIVVR